MTNSRSKRLSSFYGVMIMAGLVVIIGGMMQAKTVLVPVMVASFIAIVIQSPMSWFREKGLPQWLSMIIVLLALSGTATLIVAVVGSSVRDFLQNLPVYEETLSEKTDQFYAFLDDKGMHVQDPGLKSIIRPETAMKYAGQLLDELRKLMASGFLVLLMAGFISLEASGLPAKLKAAFGENSPRLRQTQKFNETIKSYMLIKTVISLVTGALVTACLLLIGVDYAIMWGMFAFVLNFIPNIGSIIAAIPPTLLALVQFGFPGSATVAACYLVINIVIGNMVEPRFMGKGLGLSTMMVFFSLLFWGWVFGPVGMLLSVVLTMRIKIMLESSDETQWIATLLAPNPKE